MLLSLPPQPADRLISRPRDQLRREFLIRPLERVRAFEIGKRITKTDLRQVTKPADFH